MRFRIIYFITIVILSIQCSKQTRPKRELLVCENIYKDFSNSKYCFRFFSDSSYLFTVDEVEFSHEKHETYKGHCFMKKDTLTFFPSDFDLVKAEKAVLKYDFLEFIDGRYPYKLKILNSRLKQRSEIDTLKFKDYSLFTYDSSFYNCFDKNVESYDLNTAEVYQVDQILNRCISQHLSMKSAEYFKQCIAVKNSENEIIVWVNCLCKRTQSSKNYLYNIIYVNDGGDSFFSVKINLTKRDYFDLFVNGEA
jgi:hypothetical protein